MDQQELEQAIQAKRAHILHYQGVLERYGHGRWTDLGQRRLAELRQELVDLEAQRQPMMNEGESGPLASLDSGVLP
jgi:hypothetical protein